MCMMNRISHKKSGTLINMIYRNLLTPLNLCCVQISKPFAFILHFSNKRS